MKRLMDFTAASIGLILFSPLIFILLVWIYLTDFHSPLFRPMRAGKGNVPFKMTKFRSMIANADKVGPTSTSGRDPRITSVGHFIRRFKLDEIAQLWDVFLGNMSLVGPRPQVISHVNQEYTAEEMHLLDVRPGITDFSSIVFSDEGDILKDSKDVDYDYNRLIRPWKSRLGLLYVKKNNFWMDVKLIYLTVIAIINKPKALQSIHRILVSLDSDPQLIEVCRREKALLPFPPPGSEKVFGD